MKKLLILTVLSASLLTAGENTNISKANFCSSTTKMVGTIWLSKWCLDYAASGFNYAYNLYQGKDATLKHLDEAIKRAECDMLASYIIFDGVGYNDKNRQQLIADYKSRNDKWVKYYDENPVDKQNWIKTEDAYLTYRFDQLLKNEPEVTDKALQSKAWSSIQGKSSHVEALKAHRENNAKGFYGYNILNAAANSGIAVGLAYIVCKSFASKSDKK